MDDIDRTFIKLKRLDIYTLEKLIWEQFISCDQTIWSTTVNSIDGKFKTAMNPEYLKILQDNGWTLEDYKDRIDPARKK
jgi:hypothetical protein